MSAIAALRAFVAEPAVERCAFCGAALAGVHEHVLDADDGTAQCACHACAMVLPSGARWRSAGAPARAIVAPLCDEAQWSALGVPVGVAWFFRDARGRLHVRYPGAAGVVEGRGDDDEWQALAQSLPALRELASPTEAVLVRRQDGASRAWQVPMDRCWHLAGLLRREWRGFDGGESMRARLDAWFTELDRGNA